MENKIQKFSYENKEVRTVEKDGLIWFIGRDVCSILEQPNVSQVLARLDEDDKGIHNMDTPSGNQEMLIINESGLYSLILSSRKPEARNFSRWVTKEVLPSIRKTGSYSLEQPKTKLEMLAEGFAQMAILERKHNELRDDHDELEARHEVLEEKVDGLIETQQQAEQELIDIPLANEPPAPKTIRAQINELVRAYAFSKTIPQAGVWNKLYHELKYRYGFDANARKRNNPKKNLLDIVEEGSMINELFKIASAECRIQKHMPPPTMFP